VDQNNERFVGLLEDAELNPQKYSGRLMMGRYCVSVTIPSEKILELGVNLLGVALQNEVDSAPDDEKALEAVELTVRWMHNVMAEARTDEMGMGYTVVYWPKMKWSSEFKGD
jgi:hypothetical protein